MSYRNTLTSYGSVAKFFHWLVAFLVLVMVIGGWFLGDVPEDYQGTVYNLHKLTGVTILLLMLLRALWALTNVRPLLPIETLPWQRTADHVVQLLLYVTIIAMPLSGWIGAVAGGRPPHIGDWQLSLPIAENLPLAGFAFDIHRILAITIIVLLCIHIGAAFFHHFIRRDNVLRRMLPSSDR